MLLNHILNIVLINLCHSCHNHYFQQESQQVLLATFGIVPFALASSTTRHLKVSAWTITRAFAGDTQLVYQCVSSGNGGTVKDTGSKCVESIFQPISNNFFSIFKWGSFSTAVNHHALQSWRIDPFDSNEPSDTLEHSHSPTVSSRLTSFPTASLVTYLVRQFLRTSKMLLRVQFFKYVTCLLDLLFCCFGVVIQIFGRSVLQIYTAVPRVFMMVTVAPWQYLPCCWSLPRRDWSCAWLIISWFPSLWYC